MLGLNSELESSCLPEQLRYIIHLSHAFECDAVDLPLRPIANRFGGCFCLGSGPVFVFWFVFGCLLRCFRWRNASLAGGFAGRRFWCGCVFRLLFYRFAYSKDFFVLVQCFVCLLTCKDRAISATSATLEEKKRKTPPMPAELRNKWHRTPTSAPLCFAYNTSKSCDQARDGEQC